MRTKHLCVLINIRIKGEVGTVGTVPRQYFSVDFFLCVCLCHIVLSVSCILMVTCWEKADLLALLYVMFYCVFVTFPYGVLGQVWYMIALIPEFCLLPYFETF